MPITTTTITESFSSGTIRTTTTTLSGNAATKAKPAVKAAAPPPPAKNTEPELVALPRHDTDVFMNAPSIVALSLMDNWTPGMRQVLVDGMAAMLKDSPLLTATIVCEDGGTNYTQGDPVFLKPGVHTDPNSFVVMIPTPADVPSIPEGAKDQVQVIQKQLLQCFTPHCIGMSANQMQNQTVLFQVLILELPNNKACIAVDGSHIHLDGSGYYRLIKQLNSFINGKPTTPVRWQPSPLAAIVPDRYTPEEQALHAGGWVPKYIEFMMAKLEAGSTQSSYVELVDLEEVAKLKKELLPADGSVPFISTNDILTAAAAEIFDTSIMGMLANMRDRCEGAKAGDIGNFERFVWFDREKGVGNPGYVRSAICKEFVGYESGGLPTQGFLDCDLSFITNWCSLTEFLIPPGASLLAHCPGNFVDTVFKDAVVVFKVNETTLGLNHNLANNAAVKKRMTDSKIYSRVVQGGVRSLAKHNSYSAPGSTAML